MLIKRYIDIETSLVPGKVLVLLGPRRTGKTTLLQGFMDATAKNFAFYKGDQLGIQNSLSVYDSSVLDEYVGKFETIVIDEAQMIPNVGKSLKIIVDTHPNVSLVVTGSSAFELNGQVGEPLTGRKSTHYLLPISIKELLNGSSTPARDYKESLEKLLIYGMYPDAITASTAAEKTSFLEELLDSYL